MKALTAAEMREVDRLTTERHGVASLQLMDNAGRSVFDFIRSEYGDVAAKHSAVLCGKGNNGGDGFVVARLLQEAGLKPSVYLFAEPESLRGDAAETFARLKKSGADLHLIARPAQWEAARGEMAKSRVIVDALLGTGLKGKVEGILATVVEDVNKISRDATGVHPDAVLAVDTPSGLPSDGEPLQGSAIHAHATITFTAPKLGQLISRDCEYCGRLHVCDIGSPREFIEDLGKGKVRWIEPQEFSELPLVRRVDSNKGLYGHVLLIAGSRGKSGAAILAGRAALRAGAGLATVATPDGILPIIASAQAELMTEPLPATRQGSISSAILKPTSLRALMKGKTLLALGPGIGTHKETQKVVTSMVRQTDLPTVLDADGLNAFAGRAAEFAKRKSPLLALTPHPGEMARLCGISTQAVQADRLRIAIESASAWKAYVILKGFHTILATPDGKVFVNTTGNPGMAKGGSGDVLTGILAGMTSQFGARYWERALALGIYLHGLAADDATAQRQEASLLAGEIAEFLPGTYHRFVTELRQRG
jgi:NAD(P)H-hydrate epimerase